MCPALSDTHLFATQRTLLVVDDDPVNLRVLVDILTSDYRVLVARSGDQALQLLAREDSVHLMLLDVDMPGMNGYEVLAKVRAHRSYAALPVILVTGRSEESDEAFGFEQGASDYLAKPVSAAVVRARVKTQLRLWQAHQDLYNNNLQLEQALKAVQSAKQELAQFTAMVSHELRTPVSVLLCEVELLVDGVRQASQENLESLHDELKHFSSLIEDLFDLVLNEAGTLKYCKQQCELAPVVQRSLQHFRTAFLDADIAVELDPVALQGLRVYADPHRIRQVLDNLLKNTLRYTDPGGRLRITAQQQGDKVILDCQDSSPGVSEYDLDKLFDRLYRGDKSRNRATGGAGLGLAICRTIVNAHQGSITARASPLGGVWIRVTLPVYQEPTTRAPDHVAPDSDC